jgi:hypothetical protein
MNEWKRLSYDTDIPDIIHNTHKEHFLEHVNGLYFAIGYLNKFDILQPTILSKILDDNWIEEIKLIH